jgi:hypothetical protein
MGRACIVPHSHAVIELIPKHLPESAQRP